MYKTYLRQWTHCSDPLTLHDTYWIDNPARGLPEVEGRGPQVDGGSQRWEG